MADKYDLEIEQLRQNPELIEHHWNMGYLYSQRYPLFQPCADRRVLNGMFCGCLTQVKDRKYPAATPELTKAIQADDRIPTLPENITLDMLPVFAEWQRRLDKELGRT